MNSESESPLDDAETADEGPDSQNAVAKAPSVDESRLGTTTAIDRVASRLLGFSPFGGVGGRRGGTSGVLVRSSIPSGSTDR
jgi:hypothetical protein